MSGSSSMSHNGTVADITPHGVKVALHDDSGQCGSCSIKSFCRPQGTDKQNVIDIHVASTDTFAIGEEVTVYCTERQQTAAVLMSLALPCILLIAAVLIALAAGAGESTAACCGLAATAVYYAVLYVFRHKIRTGFNRMKICHR